MRIALLADIHGNSIGLRTALDDIKQRGGVDGYWVLGDLCAIGFDPIGVLEQLHGLSNLTVIKGNADRYVTTLDLPPPTIEDARQNPDLIPILAEVYGSFHWTRGALDATGWTDWLREIPFSQMVDLPDGSQVYLVHSQPNTDTDKGLNPSRTDDELETLVGHLDVQLICVGHFHMPMHRYYRAMQIVNPGSISNTFHKDSRAYYAILTADTSGFEIQFYAVEYDLNQAITRIKATLNAGNDYNIHILSGNVVPSWKKHWDGVSHFPKIIMD